MYAMIDKEVWVVIIIFTLFIHPGEKNIYIYIIRQELNSKACSFWNFSFQRYSLLIARKLYFK